MASQPAYGEGGTCGRQHDNSVCIPHESRGCCSASGFCGSNETYCFTRYGCQSGCVDPPDFYLEATSTPAPSPTPAPVLNTGQKTGIIVGVIFFALIVILAFFFCWYKGRRRPQPAPPPNQEIIRFNRLEPSGISHTVEFPQNWAMQNPRLMESLAAFADQGHLPSVSAPAARLGPPLMWLPGPRARDTDSNALYNTSPDDSRVRDVSSEQQV